MVELSSLDVHFLARELGRVEDAYVDKVYQTGRDEYLFRLRKPQEGALLLIFRPGAYAALATQAPETPETPSATAMALRKHLSGARIRRVDQHEFDRILDLQLDVHGQPHRLLIELFGKGNLILTGPDQKILLVHRPETFAHRTLRRGQVFQFPPSRTNPKRMRRADFDQAAAGSTKDVVRFLALDLGLGGDLAEEVVHRAALRKETPMKKLVESDLERAWTALQALLAAPPQPAIARGPRRARPSALPFEGPPFQGEALQPTGSLSEAILALARDEVAAEPAPTDAERERLERQLQHQEAALVRLDEEAAAWERRGRALYEHYAEGDGLLKDLRGVLEHLEARAIAQRLKKPGPDDAWTRSVVRYDPEHRRFVVHLAGHEVPLDPRLSLERNASDLFEEAKRVRTKLKGARVALEATRRLLAERPAAPTRKAAPGRRAPAKRFWFEVQRWFYSSEGFLVVAGRDAAANERLVKRHLQPGDVYVHADFHGAPSCIVKTNGQTPGESTLREACQFAATYSRAFAQFAQADAYWVKPEQVSKTAESGEYVSKGAFVIRGKRNYHPKLPLEAGLGLVRLAADGRPGGDEAPHVRLMGGPPAAVGRLARRHVVVERGELKPAEAAKRLAPVFGVTLEEVQAVLPPGTIRIRPSPGGAP